MQQGSDSTTFLSRKTTDKECRNNLPTFNDGRKHLPQPQNGNQAILDPQTCTNFWASNFYGELSMRRVNYCINFIFFRQTEQPIQNKLA